MGLEINNKQDLKELIEMLKEMKVDKISLKLNDFEITIENENHLAISPTIAEENKKKYMEKQNLNDMFNIFNEKIEEFYPNGRPKE